MLPAFSKAIYWRRMTQLTIEMSLKLNHHDISSTQIKNETSEGTALNNFWYAEAVSYENIIGNALSADRREARSITRGVPPDEGVLIIRK